MSPLDALRERMDQAKGAERGFFVGPVFDAVLAALTEQNDRLEVLEARERQRAILARDFRDAMRSRSEHPEEVA